MISIRRKSDGKNTCQFSSRLFLIEHVSSDISESAASQNVGDGNIGMNLKEIVRGRDSALLSIYYMRYVHLSVRLFICMSVCLFIFTFV